MTKMSNKFRFTFAGVFLLALILLFSSFFSPKEETLQSIEGGGVVLTFDDYYADDWYAANQELSKYDWKATFFVAEFHNYSEDEIEKLKSLQSQGHEIGFHGKNHTNALEFTSSNSIRDYLETEILPSLNTMEQEGFTISSFAYPFGAKIRPNFFEKIKRLMFADFTDGMDNLLLEHFDIIRGTTYSRESPPQQRSYANGSQLIFGLGIDESYNNDTDYLLQLMQYARENNKIVIFYGHKILPETDSLRYATNYETLEKICQYATEHEMHFLTIRELAVDEP